MDELFARVRFANAHFSGEQPGWRTDRGRVYIKLGAPDEVLQLNPPQDAAAMQRWTYYRDNKVFVFVDRAGRGDYELARANADP